MNYIRSFEEIGAGDVALVGGKGANLGELTRAGLPVPPGFCLTAEAYRAFAESTGAGETIRQLVAETRMDDPAQVEAQTAHIRGLLVAPQMPAEIGVQILEGYHRLANQLAEQGALPVAVRSSATAEDLPTASFAGQQDTYLNIRGDDELLAHIKHCWASLWTARAVTYRAQNGYDHAQVALAVVVQAMIESDVSGIMFTANPVTGDRSEIVMNASWGLGEAIVSGLVTPDTFTVRKSDGAIVEREIAHKDRMIEYAVDGGTVERDVEAARREVPALSDEQVAALLALGMRIEEHYRVPMDVEWGCREAKFYVLQARAITTLKVQAPSDRTTVSESIPPHGEYNRTMFVEIFPDPLSPIFLSAIQPLFHSMLDFTFETLGFQPPCDMEAIGIFYNQPYFNRDYIATALKPLPPPVRQALVAQIVNPFGRQGGTLHGGLAPSYVGMLLRLLRLMRGLPMRLPKVIARYRSGVQTIAGLRLDGMADRELVVRIRQLVFGTARQLLNYDFLMIALIGVTYQLLGTLLARYYGEESEELRSRLISGITGNVTMETNKHLWGLAQMAKASPATCEALREYNGHELRTELARTQEGASLLDALDQFLNEYGHREIRMDIVYPTWGEDPSPVLAFIRGYLDVPETVSPYAQQARLVQQRKELEREVKTRLQRDLAGKLVVYPLFAIVLQQTQLHTRERDTVHFELTRLFPPFRRLLLELGRRWIANGLLAAEQDIFFLHLDELERLAVDPHPVSELVRQRRAEFEANKQHPAPSILRDGQAIEAESSVPVKAPAGQLRGIAGSAGRASGAARVIRGPEEFDRLHPGDILVAPLTNPVWTPLFAIAGGLVTEVGGILSHGAIVAREYGIPAVMAVPGATTILHEGQYLTVDGGKGIVYLESTEGVR